MRASEDICFACNDDRTSHQLFVVADFAFDHSFSDADGSMDTNSSSGNAKNFFAELVGICNDSGCQEF